SLLARKDRWPGGHADLAGMKSAVEPGTRDQMSWRIGDHGFVMTLDGEVPARLAAGIRPFVRDLLDRSGSSRQRVSGWAVHPGGARIVDEIARALELVDDEVESSRSVLRHRGNMSSATIGFVLETELDRLQRTASTDADLVLLGFGPGLTMEGAVLKKT